MKELTAPIYTKRRQELAENMDSGSILILAGNGNLERTRDVDYHFKQSNNFLYLTGISQPDALLVVYKDNHGSVTESLYVVELHPIMAVWEGRSNHGDELSQKSGITDVLEYKKTEELIQTLLKGKDQIVYLDMPDTKTAQIAAWELWRLIKETYPDQELAAINPAIEALRVIKTPEEIELIESAIAETRAAIEHVKPLLLPGVTERAIAVEFVRFCSERGFEQAWPPVISFGKSACVIHHTPDDTKLSDGDLVLFDVGVEVEGYAADISRMITIGDVSDRQKEVLQAVKDVQADALKLMKPGIKFDEFERQAAEIMCNKLIDLGLFTNKEEAIKPEGELQWPAYRRYFNHMTSHFLGLDAHDVGPRDAEFAPGMVLTCEPGIYIAEEGIGVRIEDDVLITAEGNRLLS